MKKQINEIYRMQQLAGIRLDEIENDNSQNLSDYIKLNMNKIFDKIIDIDHYAYDMFKDDNKQFQIIDDSMEVVYDLSDVNYDMNTVQEVGISVGDNENVIAITNNPDPKFWNQIEREVWGWEPLSDFKFQNKPLYYRLATV